MKHFLLNVSVALLCALNLQAQDDLFDLFGEEETIDYATASFKATRIVLGQSVENPKNGNLNFMIQHQFGDFNTGAYEVWGLDQASIRLGFEYGVNDWIGVGLGRSSYNKTFDGYTKIRMIRQSKGKKVFPVTISYFGGMYYNSLKWEDPERDNYESSRLSYCNQILIARKFSDRLTLQISPGFIHRNLVATEEIEHDVFTLPVAGRVKLSQRISLNVEYYFIFPGYTADNFEPALNVGFDIETGGHVFQVYISNARGMQEPYFIAENTGKWEEGQIHLAFNLYRTFVLKRPKTFTE